MVAAPRPTLVSRAPTSRAPPRDRPAVARRERTLSGFRTRCPVGVHDRVQLHDVSSPSHGMRLAPMPAMHVAAIDSPCELSLTELMDPDGPDGANGADGA